MEALHGLDENLDVLRLLWLREAASCTCLLTRVMAQRTEVGHERRQFEAVLTSVLTEMVVKARE